MKRSRWHRPPVKQWTRPNLDLNWRHNQSGKRKGNMSTFWPVLYSVACTYIRRSMKIWSKIFESPCKRMFWTQNRPFLCENCGQIDSEISGLLTCTCIGKGPNCIGFIHRGTCTKISCGNGNWVWNNFSDSSKMNQRGLKIFNLYGELTT